MALLMSQVTKSLPTIGRRAFSVAIINNAKRMPDPIEHATGLEKRELVAQVSGNDNPFDFRVIKRSPATKDAPQLVPSADVSRLMGCVCEEDSTVINWMWLHKGEARRCECGHYFKLTEFKPI